MAALLGVVLGVHAQPVVTASISEATIGTQERLVYTIEVKGEQLPQVETPEPPETEGLVLVQRFPATSRNIAIINGRMEQRLAFQWTYQPLREGTARIAPARVRVGDRVYETEALRVNVVPQAQRPARPRDPFARLLDPFGSPSDPPAPPADEAPAPEDLFIRVIPSRQEAYQNEQITVEYQLFFRDGIQLRQSRLTDSWDAEGFWREELDVDTRPIPRPVVQNGLRYNMIVLKRAALFPARTGRLQVDPLRIETEALVPSRSLDPFERFFSRTRGFRPVEVASAPLTITVRPLPQAPPPSFAGAVGRYTMQTRLDRATLEVGQSLQYVVTLSGNGNLATLPPPTFAPGSAFEVYDPQVDVRIDRSGNRLTGSKTFTYVLVPRSPGTFELPPVTFTYFDPQAETYETLRSEPRPVQVTGTAAPAAPALALTAGLPVDDIAGPLAADGGWLPRGRTPLHRSVWTYVLLLMPALVLAGLVLYRRHLDRLAADTAYARRRRAHPLARRHLRRAEALLKAGETRAVFTEIERAMLGFAGSQLGVAGAGLTRAELADRLARAGVPPEVRDALRRLLDLCDRVRFAPGEPARADMEEALAEAARLLVRLDDHFGETPEGGGGV